MSSERVPAPGSPTIFSPQSSDSTLSWLCLSRLNPLLLSYYLSPYLSISFNAYTPTKKGCCSTHSSANSSRAGSHTSASISSFTRTGTSDPFSTCTTTDPSTCASTCNTLATSTARRNNFMNLRCSPGLRLGLVYWTW